MMKQNRKINRAFWGILLCALVAIPQVVFAEENPFGTVEQQLKLIDSLSASLVTVEYTLQYDKGEAPVGLTLKAGESPAQSVGEHLVQDNRPFEQPGFLISNKTVLTAELIIQKRFIKKIEVRHGDSVSPAAVSARALNYGASYIQLRKPLKGVRPLKFLKKSGPPYFGVQLKKGSTDWRASVAPVSLSVSKGQDTKTYVGSSSNRIVVDAKGRPVTVTMTAKLPLDSSWKLSPMKWKYITEGNFRAKLKRLEHVSKSSLLHVKITLRSPKKKGALSTRVATRDGNSTVTEINALGLRLEKKRVLVLASLKPATTARLDRIEVFGPNKEKVNAKFEGTLADYGAFTAIMEKPVGRKIDLTGTNTTTLTEQLLMVAKVKLAGDKRISHFFNARLARHTLGFERRPYPKIGLGNLENNAFIFDLKGKLVTFPIARRQKVTSARGRYNEFDPKLTSAFYLKDVIANLDSNTDKENAPRTEKEENRLAWLGVVLQPLNRELARANNAAEQTQDGAQGGLVILVYPNSPASRAKIKPGMILLRLTVPDEPKPIRVSADHSISRSMFPWERLDEIPPEYFERVPTPWPGAASSINRTVTDIGFGKTYTAEFLDEGKIIKKRFKVEKCPPYFENSAKYEEESLGLTVVNTTYEVRQYLQRKPNSPGVVVSKIEPGSKTAIAGLKPFELITHVNSKKIKNIKQFEKALKNGTKELQFSVDRMTKSRQIIIKLD